MPRPERTPDAVRTLLAGLLATGMVLAGCGGQEAKVPAPRPKTIPDIGLDDLLVNPADVNAVMGTVGMTPHPAETQMGDNRNLLPNVNCLGVWQPTEAAIYGTRGGPSGWSAVRRRLFRAPDTQRWDLLAAQSVVSYPSPDAARDFFAQSADRWSKCTNHHVNITLNNQRLPRWLSGALDHTDDRLAMPISRGEAEDARSCQHVLAVDSNVVIDVEACTRQVAPVQQAGAMADLIEKAISAA